MHVEAGAKDKLWVLRANAVSLAYGDRTVVEDVTLEISLGEAWFLVGVDGSGKTTFLRAALGLLAPSHGTLELNPALGRNERVGYVPQAPCARHGMPSTVEELVRLGLVRSQIASSHAADRIDWALETSGMTELRGRDVSLLSGGTLQRALIARALVRRPTLLVLDEPTTNLDAAAEEEILSLVDSLNRDRQLTVVCATRDIGIATRHATHAALFAAGRVSTGLRDQVITESRLDRLHSSDPAVRRDPTAMQREP